jgi:hypothetical protein
LRSRLLIMPLALLSGAAFSGCGPGKKPIVPVPLPPVQPAAQPADETPAQPEPSPQTPVDKPVPRKPPPRPVVATPPPAPAAQPAPVPALGEILSDSRRREIETDLAQNVSRAQAAIGRTSGRTLTKAQRETVDRIRTFLQQAQQARTHDLSTALQLARRASLLGDDLMKSLQ